MECFYAIGRLGKDAELKYTPAGKAVCNFSLAVDKGYGDNKKTLWVGCALWEKKAESLAQYLTKGKQVFVRGNIDLRTWIGKNDGEANGQITCNVQEIQLLGGGEDRVQQPAAPAPAAQPLQDDDIPF